MTDAQPAGRLAGRRIAILIEDGFSARQVLEPQRVLTAEGADVVLIGNTTKSPYSDKTRTTELTAQATAGASRMRDFDALVIPGGYAPDRMRMRHQMVELVADAMAAGTPVAAVCHGPQLLITANVLRGRTITCCPSMAVDVKNAGGLYVDRPAVQDGNLITARKSDDLPVLLDTLIAAVTDRPAS